jgi:hypothetical protein
MLTCAIRNYRSVALLAAFGLLSAGEARAQTRAVVPSQSGIINNLLAKSWSDNKLTPAKRATDNEFMRRVFIDVIGRIPTADEVREFERDGSPNKRANLIERLLYKDSHTVPARVDGKPMVFEYTREYAQHWADIWTVWTMTRGGSHETYHNQMRFWLETAFSKEMPYDQMVRELLTASGAGNKNGASNFVMVHLGEKNTEKGVTDGPYDAIPITSRVTRLFLGIQTQCTQCHDHPFNPEWGQENFWGVNAFFRTTIREGTSGDAPSPPEGTVKKQKGMAINILKVSDNSSFNSGMRIFYEKRSGLLMSTKPTFLPDLADLEKDKADRTKKPLPTDGAKSRREVLADFVISHDNFGKAYVNRMWAHFFGRGLNEQAAPDDFGGHNKLLHPEMLQQLGDEFIKYKYNPKELIKWICNSDAYNLSYIAPTKEMAKPEHDPFFAHMALKAMSPEVLFNSLETAVKADLAVDKEARKAARENWMKKLVNNFGDDEGNEMTFNGTIVQALLMMNGKELNEEIRRKDGVVARIMARRNVNAVDEIFLTALGRHPRTRVEFEMVNPKTKKKTTGVVNEAEILGKGARPSDYEDLFWALINMSEFMLNH